MLVYEQNSNAYLPATWVDYKGEEATISGTPTISIYHRRAGSTITDVNAQDMTQLSDSTYFYKFHIQAAADKTTYMVKFSANYDSGITAIGDTAFLVVAKDFYTRRGGGLVQKIIGKTIWTQEEKDKLLENVASLYAMLVKSSDINKSLVKINKKSFDNSYKTMNELTKNIKKIQSKVKLITKDEKLKNQLDKILNEIQKTQMSFEKPDKLNEQTNLSLNDMKLSIDELAKMLIKIMPTEKIEEALNGH